jgi:hypothetical protein
MSKEGKAKKLLKGERKGEKKQMKNEEPN